MTYLLVWLFLGYLSTTINTINEEYQDKWKNEHTRFILNDAVTNLIGGTLGGPISLIAALLDSYHTFTTLRKEYNERKTTK